MYGHEGHPLGYCLFHTSVPLNMLRSFADLLLLKEHLCDL